MVLSSKFPNFPILNMPDAIHTPTPLLLKISFNKIIPFTPVSAQWSLSSKISQFPILTQTDAVIRSQHTA